MPLMMDGLKRRPLLLQWVVALLMLTLLLGSISPAFAQDGSGGESNGSGGIIARECDPPNRCFSSVEARQDYAAQNSCYFLEDICTDFDPEAGNRAREEDRGFWGQLWDAGVGAIQYGYEFVRGLMAGLGDQISDLFDLLSDPIEAARGLADLGRRFYEDPEGTIRSLAQLIGQEAVSTITRATQCGAYDLGRVIGQNINPVVVVRLGTRLARFGGNLDEAVAATRRDLGCASFVAGTPVLLPDGARAIEQIRKGDQVLSRDDVEWSEAPQVVTQLFNRVAPDVWELVTESETYRLTDNHPLWVQGKGWTQTKDVTNADVLSARNGDVRVISNRSLAHSVEVFNFSVANTPNYFVGEQGLWAHNQSGNGAPCMLRGLPMRDVDVEIVDGRAPLLNDPLPNTRYRVNGGQQVFEVDHLGRTTNAQATITQDTLHTTLRNCYQQGRAVAVCEGIRGQDDGGHLIGHQLGGVGERVNIVPQLSSQNRGAYRTLENQWAQMAANGDRVDVTVTPVYVGDALRPTRIDVTYTVNGGPEIVVPFNN